MISNKEFKSINEFMKYIDETPINNIFKWTRQASSDGSPSFTKTKSFEDAEETLKNGWSEMASKLTKILNDEMKTVAPKTVTRSRFDVIGYQASVPRYLQGIPTSMVNQKKVVQKQKVVTITKNISYYCSIEADVILKNNIQLLKQIEMLERKGIRVNLNIIWVINDKDAFPINAETSAKKSEFVVCKVRIKNSSERLNISKLAFPLIHPSMMRRLMFRYLEVNQDITQKSFTSGYGKQIVAEKIIRYFIGKDEIYVPPIADTTKMEEIISMVSKDRL